jgi:hypothetical protein
VITANRAICVSRAWFDDMSSMCRRISWRSCLCCFKSIFFSTNREFFRVRNDQRTNHHDFASKIFFWKALKKCIICFLSAINHFRCFIWTTNRDRHSRDYCSTRRRRLFSNQDVSRFRSLCHVSSMLFRQKIVLVAQANEIVTK